MINSRSINDLHPYVKEQFLKADAMLKSQGVTVLVVSTLRDQEYQSKLYAQGRTDKSKPIVTNAKLIGPHGFGLALDLCPMINGKCAWNRADLYQIISIVMKHHGFEWGGDWKSFVDKPHFQMTKGLTPEQLRAGKMPVFLTEKSDFDKGIDWLVSKKVITDKSYWKDNAKVGGTCEGDYVKAIIERIGRL